MKGAAIVMTLLVASSVCFGIAWATEPIVPPTQYEQFCDNQKVSGTGSIDVGTSISDKKIALDYNNFLTGDGDIELDQVHAYSQNADKLKENVSSINSSNESNLNLYEKEKLTYKGQAPLIGEKDLRSKEFYGGIGASVQEKFSVNEMEKDQTTFFTSTAPSSPTKKINPPAILIPITQFCNDRCCKDVSCNAGPQIYPVMVYNPPSVTVPESSGQLIKDLKNAGSDQAKVGALMGNNPAHTLGLETKNSFNGTWGVDATWHELFYKDLKAHEMFTGKFETDKTIKFHDNPVPETTKAACTDMDC